MGAVGTCIEYSALCKCYENFEPTVGCYRYYSFPFSMPNQSINVFLFPFNTSEIEILYAVMVR